MELLSDIELFYSENIKSDLIILTDDEFHHCTKVFRKKAGDDIFVTDGKGNLFHCNITKVEKSQLTAKINSTESKKEKFPDYYFCIPLLRNKDRFRFALEKLIELGITKIILFKAKRSVADKINQDKLKKIAIETIKQSLQTILPRIVVISSLKELNSSEGTKIIFDQKAIQKFDNKLLSNTQPTYFIFGPEGGLSEEEINCLNDRKMFSLADNRLRSETAIIKVASVVTG